MASLTKLDRVLRTTRFEETDRVPLYDIFQNDAVIEHYSGRPLTEGEEGEWTVGLAVGRALDMTRMVGAPERPNDFQRPDGLVIRQERWTSWIIKRPFADLPSLVEWVKARIQQAESQTFGREEAEQFHQHIERKWRSFAEADPTGRNDPAVLVIESGVGLTDMYWAAGMDLFVDLLVEHPGLIDEWLEANLQRELRRVRAIANPRYIPVALTYDDIAHKTGTIFSPAWLRKIWLPRLKQLVDTWKSFDTACLFHSDGNLWGVMEDLAGAGIDGLNPIETLAGMSVKGVREKYPHLFLAGGIDVSQLLALGSPDEVKETCRQAIEDTGGRGYFMGSTTELLWEVPLENALAMYETARESGEPKG